MKKNSNSVISGHRRHVFELHWPIITPSTDYSSPPTGANDFLSPHKTNVMSTVKHYLAVCVCVCVCVCVQDSANNKPNGQTVNNLGKYIMGIVCPIFAAIQQVWSYFHRKSFLKF